MKKLVLITVLLLSTYVLQRAEAQARVNVNIGVQPQWGPDGYDHVEYYYLPDIDVFYNVRNRQYVYDEERNKKWEVWSNNQLCGIWESWNGKEK